MGRSGWVLAVVGVAALACSGLSGPRTRPIEASTAPPVAAPDPRPPDPPPAPEPPPVPVPPPGPPPGPAPAPNAADLAYLNPPPEGWVDLAKRIPGIVLQINYHTPHNFTGAPIPGYGAPGAWMRQAPADALALVQDDLGAKGLGLKVFDAYRPLRGTLGMVAWAKRTDQVHLLDDGYVARRSGHNRGNTLDLTIVHRDSGEELDMGTPWDTLSEDSHTRNATGKANENRYFLKAAMEARGFKYYFREWWHFTFVEDGEPDLPTRDVPYGCFEAPEGQWKAPAGWDVPGYVMPDHYAVAPCK